jgi:hypothetical protein
MEKDRVFEDEEEDHSFTDSRTPDIASTISRDFRAICFG